MAKPISLAHARQTVHEDSLRLLAAQYGWLLVKSKKIYRIMKDDRVLGRRLTLEEVERLLFSDCQLDDLS